MDIGCFWILRDQDTLFEAGQTHHLGDVVISGGDKNVIVALLCQLLQASLRALADKAIEFKRRLI